MPGPAGGPGSGARSGAGQVSGRGARGAAGGGRRSRERERERRRGRDRDVFRERPPHVAPPVPARRVSALPCPALSLAFPRVLPALPGVFPRALLHALFCVFPTRCPVLPLVFPHAVFCHSPRVTPTFPVALPHTPREHPLPRTVPLYPCSGGSVEHSLTPRPSARAGPLQPPHSPRPLKRYQTAELTPAAAHALLHTGV